MSTLSGPSSLGAAGDQRREEPPVIQETLRETIARVERAHQSCYDNLIQLDVAINGATDPYRRKQLLEDYGRAITRMMKADSDRNDVNRAARTE